MKNTVSPRGELCINTWNFEPMFSFGFAFYKIGIKKDVKGAQHSPENKFSMRHLYSLK